MQYAPGCVCCPKVIYASRSELEGVAKMEKGTRNGAAAEVAKLLMSAHCRRKRILSFFGESRCVCICGTTHWLCMKAATLRVYSLDPCEPCTRLGSPR